MKTDFTSISELLAHYKAVRERLRSAPAKPDSAPPKAPRPLPDPVPEPVEQPIEPAPAPEKPPPEPVKKMTPPFRVAQIKRAVCRMYEVPGMAMNAPHRRHDYVLPRHVCMYLVRVLCPDLSLPRIGERFGKRDHTTVLSAIRKIERLIIDDDDVAWKVAELRRKLRGEKEDSHGSLQLDPGHSDRPDRCAVPDVVHS